MLLSRYFFAFASFLGAVDLVDFVALDFLAVDFSLESLESLLFDAVFVVLFATFSFFNASFIAPISALSKYKIRPQCGQVVIVSALISSK